MMNHATRSLFARSLFALFALFAVSAPCHAYVGVTADGIGGHVVSVSGATATAQTLGYVVRCNQTPRDYPMGSLQKDALEDAAYEEAWAHADGLCDQGIQTVSDSWGSTSGWTTTSAPCEKWNGDSKSVSVNVESYTPAYSLHIRCKGVSEVAESDALSNSLFLDPAVAACLEQGAAYGWSRAYCEIVVFGPSGGAAPAPAPKPHTQYGDVGGTLAMCQMATGFNCLTLQTVNISSGGWYEPLNTWGAFSFGNGMGAADPNPMHNPFLGWFQW